MIVLVTGVAGAGKSTVSAALAARLGWDFVEGDALHPPANRTKMSGGLPLDDVDRVPWLTAVQQEIDDRLARGRDAVIAVSALRETHREQLRVGDPRVLLVFLDIPPHLARARLGRRRAHFFGAALADSQFAALEPPAGALRLHAATPVDELVDAIVEHVGQHPRAVGDGHDH